MTLDQKTYKAEAILSIKQGRADSRRVGGSDPESDSLLGGSYIHVQISGMPDNMKPGDKFEYTRGSMDILGVLLDAVAGMGGGGGEAGGGSSDARGPPMTRFIRFTLATAAMALAAAGAHALEPRQGVKLRALDKITGNSTDISAKVGETLTFGRLKVDGEGLLPVAAGRYAGIGGLPRDPRDAVAGKGAATDAAADTARHASRAAADRAGRPAVLGLDVRVLAGAQRAEHPTYDVWVISCNTSAPVNPPPAAPATPN